MRCRSLDSCVDTPGVEAFAHGTACEILVVDDNPSNLLAMEAALEDLGHVIRAESGEAALHVLLERDVALVLLDVQMPSLGGLETARLIRQRQRSRHTPIIFVSAYGRDEQEVLSAYRLGAVDFLFKPINLEILQSKAAVFVELQRRTAQLALQAAKLREHERREHERTLEAERQRWNEEALRRRMEELAETDRRKDEFLAVLGHELRNPLSAIMLGCEILRQKLTANPTTEQAVLRARDRIERQSHNLCRLVDDLLDLSRINSGKIVLKKALVSVQDAIEEAVSATRQAAEARGHRLLVDMPRYAIRAWADPVRLTQMVTNLLHNAIRYTDDHGEISVRCSLREETKEVVIEVSDSGRGIDAKVLPLIFDMFVQAKGNGDSHGLGLGLAIVKRMVELHHGRVQAESAGLGQGSTFTLILPLEVEPGATSDVSAVQSASAPSDAARMSIVLVEDNEDIREGMQELLTGLGHTVAVARDGGSGADLILRVAPQVAIVDLGLPVLDGYEVAARVRAQVGPERVRLVAMTGFGQESDRRRAREAGFDAHLVKPADVDAVVRALSAKEC